MKIRSIQVLMALTAIAGTARTATAAEPASPWSLSISGGDSLDERGALRTSALTSFDDLGTLDPTLSGNSGALRLDRLRYEDLFRRRFDTGLELNYSFDENLQTYGRFGYDALGGRTSSIGFRGRVTTPTACGRSRCPSLRAFASDCKETNMSSSRNDHVCGDSFDYARYPRAPVADVRVSVKPAGTQGLEMAARRG